MSVENPTNGEKFTVAVYTRLQASSEIWWRNTYNLMSQGCTGDDLKGYARLLRLYTKQVTSYNAEIFRITVSAHVPGGFDDTGQWSLTLVEPCEGAVAGSLGVEMCFRLIRQTEYGRISYSYYRNSVLSSLVVLSNGKLTMHPNTYNWMLGNIPIISGIVEDGRSIDQLFVPSASCIMIVPSSRKGDDTYRQVTAIAPSQGVTHMRMKL